VDDINKFYEAQKKHRDQDTIDPERIEHVQTWLRDDTVDAWRHRRMYKYLDPLLDCYPEASWLTVGDGRFASDARYIREKINDVTATDISLDLLIKAKEMGYIEKISGENAEALSFEDNAFDFVLCKESYHHFPRPMIALYEMLRVARQAAILIEPFDGFLGMGELKMLDFQNGKIPLRDIIRALLKKMRMLDLLRKLRSISTPPSGKCFNAYFESSGNFVYSISKGEIAKVALGMNLSVVAFAGFNDQYEKGVEFEKATQTSELFRKVRKKIEEKDRSGMIQLLVALVFKNKIDEKMRKALKEMKYEIHDLPENPYL